MMAGRIDEREIIPIEMDDFLNNESTQNESENIENTENEVIKQFRKKSTDRSFTYLKAQIIITVIFVAVVIAFKAIGGAYFEYISGGFSYYFDTPINKAQVLGVEEAKAVIAAQSTIYGMGGESADESVLHIEDKSELSTEQSSAIATVNKMAYPTKSRTITCEYGYRIHPITKKDSFHTGIDIGEDMNEPIFSVLDGTVKRIVLNDYDYGNYLIITHSNGVESMYAHASVVNVKKGQMVKKGDVVAKVGTTGLSTGPHLHFEVRINDIRLNPRWFINF